MPVRNNGNSQMTCEWQTMKVLPIIFEFRLIDDGDDAYAVKVHLLTIIDHSREGLELLIPSLWLHEQFR